MQLSEALIKEENNFINAVDAAADTTLGYGTFMGPTKVDFSMIGIPERTREVEQKMMARWKAMDLAAYYKSLRRSGKQTEFRF